MKKRININWLNVWVYAMTGMVVVALTGGAVMFAMAEQIIG